MHDPPAVIAGLAMTAESGSPRVASSTHRIASDASVPAFAQGASRRSAARTRMVSFESQVRTAKALSANVHSPQGDGCSHLREFLQGYFHQGWPEEFNEKNSETVLDKVIPRESRGALEKVLQDIDSLLREEEISARVLRELRIDDCCPESTQHHGWFSMMRREIEARIADLAARTYLVAR